MEPPLTQTDDFQNRKSIRVSLLIEILDGDIDEESFSFFHPTLKCGRLSRYVESSGNVLPQQSDFEKDKVFYGDIEYEQTVSLWKNSTNDSRVLLYTADLDCVTPLESLVGFVNWIFENDDIALAPIGIHSPQAAVRTKYCLVYLPTRMEVPDFDFQQRIIYRSNLSACTEYINLVYPPELNRRENTGTVLGPLVALFWGQQDYVENLSLLSAIMAVGAESGIRSTQTRALALLKEVDSFKPTYEQKSSNRLLINDYLSEIATLENLLVLSADVGVNLFTAVPSLRPADFHRSLYSALEIKADRELVGHILERVNTIVVAKAEQLRSMEEAVSNRRNRRWAISLAVASTITIPFSLIFGYFSLEGTQPDPDHLFINVFFYWGFYLVLFLGIFLILALHFGFYKYDSRALRRDYDGSQLL